MIRVAANQAGVTGLRFVLDEYPPPPPGEGAPSPLRTAKQWRWWWASMRDIARGRPVSDSLRGWKARYVTIGKRKVLKISGHYKRTGTMVRSITYDVQSVNGAWEVAIGPSMARGIKHKSSNDEGEYAKYVIGKKDQARIHQGRWAPLVDIVDSHSKEIMQSFLKAFAAEVQRGVHQRNR